MAVEIQNSLNGDSLIQPIGVIDLLQPPGQLSLNGFPDPVSLSELPTERGDSRRIQTKDGDQISQDPGLDPGPGSRAGSGLRIPQLGTILFVGISFILLITLIRFLR